MAALGWLLNLDFAGSGVAEEAAAVSSVNQRLVYVHRRKRPYISFSKLLPVRWSHARSRLASRA